MADLTASRLAMAKGCWNSGHFGSPRTARRSDTIATIYWKVRGPASGECIKAEYMIAAPLMFSSMSVVYYMAHISCDLTTCLLDTL